MSRSRLRTVATSLAVAALAGFLSQPAAQAAVVVDVAIDNFSFQPRTVNVDAGTTIRWTNLDAARHNVVDVTNGRFTTTSLGTGEQYSTTVGAGESTTYQCTLHSGMDGVIEVLAVEPPPVVPEVPSAMLLPLAAAAACGLALTRRWRRTS